MAIKSYRDLLVWQRAMSLAEESFRLTEHFPRREIYGLTAQLRRSAISIPANIAEGNGRRSTREYLHFLSVALGSTLELETQMLLAVRLNYVQESDAARSFEMTAELGRMMHGLRNSLGRRAGIPP